MTKEQKKSRLKLIKLMKALKQEIKDSDYLASEDYHLQGDLENGVNSMLDQIGAK